MSNLQALNREQILSLARQRSIDNDVVMIYAGGNWGPPVSGRCNSDYLTFWAAVRPRNGLREVLLYGARMDNDWSLFHTFKHETGLPEGVELFSLTLYDPGQFPASFVIRAEYTDGTFCYDNNVEANYHLQPYGGYHFSAFCGSGVIFDLKMPRSVSLHTEKV